MAMLDSLTRPRGALSMRGAMGGRIIRGEQAAAIARVNALMADFRPASNLGLVIRRTIPFLPPDLAAELIDKVRSVAVIESRLSARVLRGLGLAQQGLMPEREVVVEDLGVVSTKVVTTAFVNYLVDAFQNSTELENLKYHALGTDATAEAVGQTALLAELTTEYTGNVRATGSTTEGASANIYKTVGTNTLDGTPGAALREHAVMSQAATGSGTMLDRSVYAAVTLASGDAYETTYELTCTAGG